MKEEQKRIASLCRDILDNKLEPNKLSIEDLEQVRVRLTEMDVQTRAQLVKVAQALQRRHKLTAEEEELLRKIHSFLAR